MGRYPVSHYGKESCGPDSTISGPLNMELMRSLFIFSTKLTSIGFHRAQRPMGSARHRICHGRFASRTM